MALLSMGTRVILIHHGDAEARRKAKVPLTYADERKLKTANQREVLSATIAHICG